MSSNNLNTHPDYDPNIRIKSEPGTMPEPSTSSMSLETQNLDKTIKTEPGFSAPPTSTRLTSYRVPRDLTLGGHVKSERPKKIYVPNLNVKRKNREEQNVVKNENSIKTSRGRGRDKVKSERGRGRGKLNNIIQSTGIFSDGLADTSTRRSGSGFSRDRGEGSSSGRENSTNLERPKLSIPYKVDKAEEEEKLRELLKDDFIDDGNDGTEDNGPVTLPMVNRCKSKIEVNKSITAVEDSKKSILQNGEANAHNARVISAEAAIKDFKLPITVPQVIENKTNSFILVQLPDCLPGLVSDESQNDTKLKPTVGTSKDTINDQSGRFCTLDNLKEGMLGRLQIFKSGKARLVFGDNNLIVDVGSNISFRQDLIATKISDDKQSGNLINLGPVNSTLICSPDWETMLQNL